MVAEEKTLLIQEEWTPSDITFYLDGQALSTIPADKLLLPCYKDTLISDSANSYCSEINLPQLGTQQEEKICRICHDDDGELIAPCLCSGSIKWVHRACINEWRAKTFYPENFVSCPTCKQHYVLEHVPVTDEGKKKFRRLVGRDIFLFIAVVFAALFICECLSYLINLTFFPIGNYLPESWQTGSNRYFFAFAMGICIFFAVIGVLATICICLGSCCQAPAPDAACGFAFWWFIFCYPDTTHYSQSRPAGFNCGDPWSGGACTPNCGGCTCHGGGCDGGGGGGGDAVVALIFFICCIFILIGIIAFLFLGFTIVSAILARHMNIRYHISRTEEYPLMDLDNIAPVVAV